MRWDERRGNSGGGDEDLEVRPDDTRISYTSTIPGIRGKLPVALRKFQRTHGVDIMAIPWASTCIHLGSTETSC